MQNKAVEVIERQFTAYNEKNADGWAATYAEDALQLSIDGTVLASGRAEIQEKIKTRFLEPDLKAILLDRKVYDNVVIDHEQIIRNFPEGNGSIEMLCIYLVEDGHIKRGIFNVFNQQLTNEPCTLR